MSINGLGAEMPTPETLPNLQALFSPRGAELLHARTELLGEPERWMSQIAMKHSSARLFKVAKLAARAFEPIDPLIGTDPNLRRTTAFKNGAILALEALGMVDNTEQKMFVQSKASDIYKEITLRPEYMDTYTEEDIIQEYAEISYHKLATNYKDLLDKSAEAMAEGDGFRSVVVRFGFGFTLGVIYDADQKLLAKELSMIMVQGEEHDWRTTLQIPPIPAHG